MFKSILKTKSKSLQDKINDAPLVPGCYLFKNKNGKVIYVGKAKILKNRVKSYFINYKKLDSKTQKMVENAIDVEFIPVDSEVEALILENNLIKKYKPKYNIMMRDDKNYIFVRLEKIRKSSQPLPNNESYYQDFPRITIVRENKEDGAEYFGPFPSTLPVKRILRKIRRIFPYRTTTNLVYVQKDGTIYSSNKKRCLYCHIGLCGGACAGLEPKSEYIKNFNAIRKFFKGEKPAMLNELESKMKEASKNEDFEKAARLRDRINDIKYVTQNIKLDNTVDDVAIEEIQRTERKNAVNELIEHLDFPHSASLQNHKGFRIECYDISNIQGKNAVGAMTVMIDGEVQPKLYRRFRIRMKNEPNDFAMLQEVLSRRFKRLAYANNLDSSINGSETNESKGNKKDKDLQKEDESFSQIPDLIIIDGGKGQLASTYKILYNYNLHNTIPIVGLAKREEDIYKLSDQFKDEINQINDSNMFTKIHLPRKSEALYLVQRIRDEAHRFGITYHRKLRSKKFLAETVNR